MNEHEATAAVEREMAGLYAPNPWGVAAAGRCRLREVEESLAKEAVVVCLLDRSSLGRNGSRDREMCAGVSALDALVGCFFDSLPYVFWYGNADFEVMYRLQRKKNRWIILRRIWG